MAILEAVHYFTTVTIFIILSLILYIYDLQQVKWSLSVNTSPETWTAK